METDEFQKVLAGNVRLAVGRKGSGKTALFFQVRDARRGNKKNVVLDLKPEGHQLKRFKHQVLTHLTEPVQEHVATAFWEYVLLLEICYKLLEKDRHIHIRDHTLYEPYQRLAVLYDRDHLTGGDADFSERMMRLVNRLGDDFSAEPGVHDRYLSVDQVTQLVFKEDIPELRGHLLDYSRRKDGIVVLFDNIDKGWPTRGIETADIVILRGLLDASRKLEKMFRAKGVSFTFTAFVRNDVFEFLVSETPDRGKESRVSLDWTDPELLRELLRRRLAFNGLSAQTFQQAWQQVAVSYVQGEDAAQFLIDRSMVRPRNFLRLFNHAKSSAVNLGHLRIDEVDLLKAAGSFSADVVSDVGLEIRDVFPAAEDLLYAFIEAKPRLTRDDIYKIFDKTPLIAKEYDTALEALLWFAFLGVARSQTEMDHQSFIYDVYYDMKKLQHLANGIEGGVPTYCIHKAFRPFLDIR